MALLFFTGFDHLTDALLMTRFTSQAGGPATISTTQGRRSSYAMYIAGGGNGASNTSVYKTLSPMPGDASFYIGAAWKLGAIVPSASTGFLQVLEFGIAQITFSMNPDLTISVRRGDRSGTILTGGTSGATGLATGTYAFIECGGTIHNSTGVITVKVNGTTVLTTPAQDTQFTATATWNAFGIGTNLGGGVMWNTGNYVDDLYVCDGVVGPGPSPLNTFLGDIRIDAHVPNAAGSVNGSTPSTGSDRSLNVDETTPDGDTTYNTLTADEQTDTYELEALKATGLGIMALQVLAYSRKVDSGVGSVCPVIEIGGTVYEGTEQGLGTDYQYIESKWTTNPVSLGNFTESEFNTLEAGLRRKL